MTPYFSSFPRTSLRSAALILTVLFIALGPSAVPASAAPAYQGVTLHSLSLEHWADMERDLDAAQESGADVIRVDVSWYTLEGRGKGTYDTSGLWYRDRMDIFMAEATARGLKVVPVLWQTPCWAADAPDWMKGGCPPYGDWGFVTYPPANPADYGDIAAYIAERYPDAVTAIEIWNEPNHGGFFTAPNPAKSYADLVKAAYPRIKAVAPGVKVLAGSLSTADAGFLNRLYGYGIRGSYDAISVHPYMIDSLVAPDALYPDALAQFSFLKGLKLIRTTQTAAGDRTPVWATEFGWNTSQVNVPIAGAWLNGVTEAIQADYLGRALALLADRRSGLRFVEGAIIYNLRDNGLNPLDVNHNFGIVRYDFTRKPSFSVVRDAFTGG
jgi:hypothetical protein